MAVAARVLPVNTSRELALRPEAEAALLASLWNRPAKVVVKADLLPAISVLSLVGLLGIPVGWLWSRLAPPTHFLVQRSGPVIMPQEDFHAFDAVALFGFFGIATGILIGGACWLMRERRGPVFAVATVLGALVAGWLATQVGAAFANSHYALTGTPSIGAVVATAPVLGAASSAGAPWSTTLPFWTHVGLIGLWPFGAALAYGLLTSWNSRDDLGRRLS